MPNATILGHLGLFVRRRFPSTESCRRIRGEMTAGDRVPAMVRLQGQAGGTLHHQTRRTGIASVSASTTALVEDALRAIQPALEEHFQCRSAGWQRSRDGRRRNRLLRSAGSPCEGGAQSSSIFFHDVREDFVGDTL
jgi:hypothetical protein